MAAGIYCKGCGYDLCGIGAGACPECARVFDPASAQTFDTVPRRTRLNRWLRRLASAVAVLMLAAAFFPRGYANGSLAITMPDGSVAGFTCVELIPPAWLHRATGVRYPRWVRRSAAAPLASGRSIEFHAGGKRFTFRGTESLGSCAAWCDQDDGQMQLNGVAVAPENADKVFATVVPNIAAGAGFGVSMGGGIATTTRETIGRN